MNTQTGPDPQPLFAVCMFLLYHESIGLLGISFVLEGACWSTMYLNVLS